MTRDFTRHILDCSPNKWVAQASPYGSKLGTARIRAVGSAEIENDRGGY